MITFTLSHYYHFFFSTKHWPTEENNQFSRAEDLNKIPETEIRSQYTPIIHQCFSAVEKSVNCWQLNKWKWADANKTPERCFREWRRLIKMKLTNHFTSSNWTAHSFRIDKNSHLSIFELMTEKRWRLSMISPLFLKTSVY